MRETSTNTTASVVVPDEVVAALAEVPTANIGDAMERMRVCDSGIKTTWVGGRLAGRALTVTTRSGDNKALHDALALASPGDVMVVNGGGDVDRALVGELLAERARAVGIVGFVIDGAARDIDAVRELGMPLFARAVSPAGPYKHGPGIQGEAAAIGRVVVQPGDIVLGDDDGVVVVPAAQAKVVLERGLEVGASESARRDEIRATARSLGLGRSSRSDPTETQE